MRKILLVLAMLSPAAQAINIPNFTCEDIRRTAYNTDADFYTQLSKEKMPVPYGSYRYATDKNSTPYFEIIITNELNDDGWYYGSLYLIPDGQLSYDLRCKLKVNK
ncbi:TPA: hypothetical protein ACXIY6_003752 [Serratia marcescens]